MLKALVMLQVSVVAACAGAVVAACAGAATPNIVGASPAAPTMYLTRFMCSSFADRENYYGQGILFPECPRDVLAA
jgi:hypothetical protein